MISIGGLTPCTTIDYPGELAAVAFCQGCPWRCVYCHNRHLLDPFRIGSMSWERLAAFMARRKKLLDAIVFSGGEPTMQPGIMEAVWIMKGMGFRVGLHTAGAYPQVLERLLPYLDWVGMDIKAPFEDYVLITGAPDSGRLAEASAEMVRESGVPRQFRTTLHPLLAQEGRLERLRNMVVTEWGEQLIEQSCNAIDTFVSKFKTGELVWKKLD